MKKLIILFTLLCGVAHAQNLSGTNTFTDTTIFIKPRLDLGGDAPYDLFYRGTGGVINRLGIGSNGQVLGVSGGVPTYVTPTPVGQQRLTQSAAYPLAPATAPYKVYLSDLTNTIKIDSIALTALNMHTGNEADLNATSLFANAGFRPFKWTSTGTNTPLTASTGSGVMLVRTAATRVGAMMITNPNGLNNRIYYRNGLSDDTYGPWDYILKGADLATLVPTSRTITINGTTLDLSANRTWTIAAGSGTVTSITPGYGHTSSTPITTSGTITVDTNIVRSVLNSWSKGQADARYFKLASPNAATSYTGIVTNDVVNPTLALTNSGSNAVALNVVGGQVLLNGPTTINAPGLSSAQFSFSGSSPVLFAKTRPLVFNSAGGINSITHTWADPTAARFVNWRDMSGDVAFTSEIPSNYITSNTTQTGLTGNKELLGTWTFKGTYLGLEGQSGLMALRWTDGSGQLNLRPSSYSSSITQYLSGLNGTYFPYVGLFGPQLGKMVKFTNTGSGDGIEAAVAGVDYSVPTPIVEISGTSQTANANTIYIPHNAALTTITAPSSTVIGSLIQIIGEGAGGWKLQLQSGYSAKGVGSFTTTSGGSISSTDRYCTLTLRLVAANTFVVTTSQGTLAPL
jgi:hypothetical protein